MSMAMIDEFLALPALALIGMSRSGKKFGNFAHQALVSKGYRVYPIHPTADVINGVKCYSEFADLPEPVQGVLIVLPPEQAVAAIRKVAAAGIQRVWLQQGSSSPEALAVCRNEGIHVIFGECILMFARPAGLHRAHRLIWGLLGKLPA